MERRGFQSQPGHWLGGKFMHDGQGSWWRFMSANIRCSTKLCHSMTAHKCIRGLITMQYIVPGAWRDTCFPPLILGSLSFDIGSVREYHNWLLIIHFCYVMWFHFLAAYLRIPVLHVVFSSCISITPQGVNRVEDVLQDNSESFNSLWQYISLVLWEYTIWYTNLWELHFVPSVAESEDMKALVYKRFDRSSIRYFAKLMIIIPG